MGSSTISAAPPPPSTGAATGRLLALGQVTRYDGCAQCVDLVRSPVAVCGLVGIEPLARLHLPIADLGRDLPLQLDEGGHQLGADKPSSSRVCPAPEAAKPARIERRRQRLDDAGPANAR